MAKESGKRHIMVADDDPGIRGLLRSFLENEGFTVSEARTGREVLKALDDDVHPDLLLMDIRMPELSGMEVLQRLRDQNLDVPTLLMTAFGSSNLAIKAIQMGAYDYIAKPFDLEDVLLTINRFFEYQDLS